jgi:pimeloyl-ACP methyl ester carboxylesterase
MGTALADDGARIAYQPQGDGPPLLLLAGQANTHHWWDPVRGDFGGRQTVSLDWRGTGDSDRRDVVYSTEGFADDVIAVLDDAGIEAVDVYGTSMGGRVAQWLAIRYPERVRSLVLGCTSPGKRHGFERSQEIRQALARADQAGRDRILLDLMYTPAWLANNPGPYYVLGDSTMPTYARGRHLVASNNHDAWDELPAIKSQTLILHGADDLFSPAANADLLATRIPNARAHLIPRARHAYFHEFQAVASQLVRDFLAFDSTRS